MWSPFHPLISKHVVVSSRDDSACPMLLLCPSHSLSLTPEQCVSPDFPGWSLRQRRGWTSCVHSCVSNTTCEDLSWPPEHFRGRAVRRTKYWTIAQCLWAFCSTNMRKSVLDSSFLQVDSFYKEGKVKLWLGRSPFLLHLFQKLWDGIFPFQPAILFWAFLTFFKKKKKESLFKNYS